MRGRSWVIAILISLAAHPSHAENYVFGAEAFASYNHYAMDQVNDDLHRLNQAYPQLSDFRAIETSIAGGLGMRFWMSPNVLFLTSWEPLYGETQGTVPGFDSVDQPYLVDVRYNVNGNAIEMGAAYFFPSRSPLRLGLGAELGFYWVRGEAVTDHQTGPSEENFETSEKISGSNPGGLVMGVGEWAMTPSWAVTALAGYRYAKIRNTKFDGEPTYPGTETDYSGYVGRLGLAFYLPLR